LPQSPIDIVFVHGWSVTNTRTYGGLPERLVSEGSRHGLKLQKRHIYLGRYVSFHDEVRVEDIAAAMEAAVMDQKLGSANRFFCVTHSTGGPVVREWFDRFYARKRKTCPMSHLVMLAPANFGSALAQLGNISERRSERLINPAYSELPAFLTRNPGVNTGFMMAQVTAAALVSENKGLAHPASVDSIPTSGNEDFVSMSMGAALKARQVADNVRTILAVELLCACQGIDLLAPLKTSPALQQALAALRSRVPMLEADRELAPDIEAARQLISEQTFQTLLTGS